MCTEIYGGNFIYYDVVPRKKVDKSNLDDLEDLAESRPSLSSPSRPEKNKQLKVETSKNIVMLLHYLPHP